MSSTKHFVRRAGPALLALVCAAPIAVLAQNPQPQPQQQPAVQPAPVDAQQDADKLPGARNQRIEHIHVEDNNATVDELRVGGQTQSITVKPNSGRRPTRSCPMRPS